MMSSESLNETCRIWFRKGSEVIFFYKLFPSFTAVRLLHIQFIVEQIFLLHPFVPRQSSIYDVKITINKFGNFDLNRLEPRLWDKDPNLALNGRKGCRMCCERKKNVIKYLIKENRLIWHLKMCATRQIDESHNMSLCSFRLHSASDWMNWQLSQSSLHIIN